MSNELSKCSWCGANAVQGTYALRWECGSSCGLHLVQSDTCKIRCMRSEVAKFLNGNSDENELAEAFGLHNHRQTTPVAGELWRELVRVTEPFMSWLEDPPPNPYCDWWIPPGEMT